MSDRLRDQTYIVGRERRQHTVATPRDRRSSRRSRRYIAIPHRSVSRRHAEVIVLNQTIYLRDLGSKNGTFLYDRETREKRRITEGYVEPGQLVMFGDCVREIGDLIRQREIAAEAPPNLRSMSQGGPRGEGHR